MSRHRTLTPFVATVSSVLGLSLCIAWGAVAEDGPVQNWPVPGPRSSVVVKVNKDVFEPSGAAVQGKWLYVVSDNGKIGRVRLESSGDPLDVQDLDRDWFGKDKDRRKAENDFESLAVVPGDPHLYLGIEGDGDALEHPKILRYLPPAEGTALSEHTVTAALGTRQAHTAWVLNDPDRQAGRDEEVRDGMEAMTFLPDGVHPYPTTGHNRAFAGVFLVASQKQNGRAFAYDLKTDGTVRVVGVLNAPLKDAMLSDLYFAAAPDMLYALYDEGSRFLQEISLVDRKFMERRDLPVHFKVHEQMQGVEAVALAPNGDLYLGLDQTRGQAGENDNCIGSRTRKDDGTYRCDDTWNNFVYRYQGFRFETGLALPAISGMAPIDQTESTARYLLVRDLKGHQQGDRLLVLTTTETGRQYYEPVRVEAWQERREQPSDLESICPVPGKDKEFLLLESTVWTGDRGNLPSIRARLFHITLEQKGGHWTAAVLHSARLPEDDSHFETRQGGRFYKWNFEGMVCPRYDASTGTATLLLADRATGPMSTLIEATVQFTAETSTIQFGQSVSLENLVKPTGQTSAGFRQCSDLCFEPLANDATRGRLWGACTYDLGDGGPFSSLVCPVAILDKTPGQPVVVKPVIAAPAERLVLDGIKVEAISRAPSFGSQRLCIATDDEHFGGLWRLLKVPTPAE